MQRRKLDHVFDARKHFVGDEHGIREAFAAMHDAMADGVNVCNAADAVYARAFR